MSQDNSYWANAFKFCVDSYNDSNYRLKFVDKAHFMDEIDNHDFPKENSNLSERIGNRYYAPPYGVDYPRECGKFVGKYFDCRREHGVYSLADDAPQHCNSAKAALFEECPHWVIENMAAKKKFYRRAEMIDRLTYQRAMEVSDYNK